MSKIQCKLSMRTLTALPTLFKSPGLHPTNCLTHSAYLAILQDFAIGEYSSFVHHLANFVTSLLSRLTLLKNWSIRSARTSSYGCTYEVWRVSARVARGAVALCFLSQSLDYGAPEYLFQSSFVCRFLSVEVRNLLSSGKQGLSFYAKVRSNPSLPPL